MISEHVVSVSNDVIRNDIYEYKSVLKGLESQLVTLSRKRTKIKNYMKDYPGFLKCCSNLEISLITKIDETVNIIVTLENLAIMDNVEN